MPAVIANLDFVKEQNTSIVFKAIMEHGAISRIRIARECQLAAGSVTRITRQLLEHGLITELESPNRERGRPEVLLVANTDDLQILTVSASRHRIHYGLCNLAGQCLIDCEEPLTAVAAEQLLRQIIGSVQNFLVQQSGYMRRLIGMGITTPGLVHSETGVVHSMPHLQVCQLPLAEQLKQATGLPCFAGNLSSAMALAEHLLSPTPRCRNSLLVSIHNGVGAGMILNGQLYEGNALSAGEIGHIQVDPFGPRCYCGNFGCLESYVSNSAIEHQCHQQIAAGMSSCLNASATMHDICLAARQGDELALRLLRQAADVLGRVLAMCATLITPEKIIFAGEIATAFAIIEPIIRQHLARRTLPFTTDDVQLEQSTLFQKRWLGAYALVRKALLEQGLLLQVMNSTKTTNSARRICTTTP